MVVGGWRLVMGRGLMEMGMDSVFPLRGEGLRRNDKMMEESFSPAMRGGAMQEKQADGGGFRLPGFAGRGCTGMTK